MATAPKGGREGCKNGVFFQVTVHRFSGSGFKGYLNRKK
jgi:hypothetical protein